MRTELGVRFKGAEDTSWELDAAESIEQVDETHVKFKLKQGIKWSGDFGEMTADDVKYSLERIANPNFKSPYASDWASLDHVEESQDQLGCVGATVRWTSAR